MATKRINASVLLDEERYTQLRGYAERKKVDTDGAVTLLLNTGLSRIASLDKYQGGKPKTARKAKAPAKPKAQKAAKAKPAAKAKSKPAKAAKAKPKAKPAAKPAIAAKKASPSDGKPKLKVVPAKKGAAPIAPQRSVPASLAANASPVQEAAGA